MSIVRLILCFAVSLLIAPPPAQAYIGPGAGAGTIAVVLGILASIVMAFFGVLWYPAKRLLNKRKRAREKTKAAHAQADENPDQS